MVFGVDICYDVSTNDPLYVHFVGQDRRSKFKVTRGNSSTGSPPGECAHCWDGRPWRNENWKQTVYKSRSEFKTANKQQQRCNFLAAEMLL